MTSLLTQLGANSFSTLFTPTPSPAAGEQTVTSSQDANSAVDPTINTTVESQPYNFLLGTPEGSTNPDAVADGTDATEPVDDGEPEYSLPDAPADLGSDAYTDPADLDPSTFEAWSQEQQLEYMSYWNLSSAVIGANDGAASALYVSVDAGQVDTTPFEQYALTQAAALDSALPTPTGASPADLGAAGATAPADLDPDTFDSWTSAQQSEYLAYWGVTAATPAVIGANDASGGADALYVSVSSSGQITATPLAQYALSQATTLDNEASTSISEGAPSDLGANGAVAPADLDPSVFDAWTSEQQSEYMNYWGASASSPSMIIGSDDADGGADAITAVLSQSLPGTVYIVNNLQATDVADMSAADLAAVAATAEFQNVIGPELGLSTDTSTALSTIQDDINTILGTTTTTTTSVIDLDSSTQSSVTYTAAQVADGDITIPSDGTTSQTLSDGSTQTDVVVTASDGSVVDIQTIVAPDDAATVSAIDYTTNSGGSVTVSVYESTGSSSTSTSAPVQNVEGAAAPTDGTTVSGTPADGLTITSITTGANGSATTTTISTIGSSSSGGGGGVGLVSSVSTATTTPTTTVSTPAGPVTVADMPAADAQVFIDELQLLQQQVNASAVVNNTQISTDVQAIMQRFTQAALYWNQSTPTTTTTTTANGTITSGVVSTDGNASISQAYTSFIQQEQAILQAAQDAEGLSSSSESGSPDLDAPTAAMIALTASMSSQQAQIEVGSTQLQQIQDLLQDVSAMQNLVNTTVNSLQGNTTNTTGLTTGASATANPVASSTLSASDLTLAEMFSSNLVGSNLNPILQEYGISLPSITLINSDGSLAQNNAQDWDNIGTELSNLVTQLQEQAQTLTTTVNQQTQQMNNTYTEMTGIVGQVGTVINTIGTNMAG